MVTVVSATRVVGEELGASGGLYASAERVCLYCRSGIFAAPLAKSVVCPGCQRRVNVAHYDFREDAGAEDLVTAGRVVVHRGVEVRGSIAAARVQVAGQVEGWIAAYECVIRSTARVRGRVLCCVLRVEPGAEVIGEVERLEMGEG